MFIFLVHSADYDWSSLNSNEQKDIALLSAVVLHEPDYILLNADINEFFAIDPFNVYDYYVNAVRDRNEEVFHIISGEGTLRTPDGEKIISKGDVIVMPANENGAHQLVNTSDSPLVYLEVKTSVIPEICIQPDSNKAILISPPKIFGKAFKLDSDVEYLNGELDDN